MLRSRFAVKTPLTMTSKSVYSVVHISGENRNVGVIEAEI